MREITVSARPRQIHCLTVSLQTQGLLKKGAAWLSERWDFSTGQVTVTSYSVSWWARMPATTQPTTCTCTGVDHTKTSVLRQACNSSSQAKFESCLYEVQVGIQVFLKSQVLQDNTGSCYWFDINAWGERVILHCFNWCVDPFALFAYLLNKRIYYCRLNCNNSFWMRNTCTLCKDTNHFLSIVLQWEWNFNWTNDSFDPSQIQGCH